MMMERQGACIFRRPRRVGGSCSSIAGSRFRGLALFLVTAPASAPAPAPATTSAVDEVDDPVARDAVQNGVISATFSSGEQLAE